MQQPDFPVAQLATIKDDALHQDHLRRIHRALYKFREIISVKDFGAVGNGSANDTPAIQAAINFASSITGGGLITFPAGTYKITSGLTAASPITLLGLGAVIAPNFGTGDALSVTIGLVDNAFICDGLTFKASVTRTADYYVNFVTSSYSHIYNCNFINGYNGVGITGLGANNVRLDNLRFQSCSGNNIDITASNGLQGCVDTALSNILMAGSAIGSQSAMGINITAAGDLTLERISTVFCSIGLNVVPPNGKTVQALFMSNVFFDTGSDTGIIAGGTGTGFIGLLKGTNVWSCSNGVNGISLGGGSGTANQTDLMNVNATGNTGVGILIAPNAVNTNIIGGAVSQNGSHGIAVAANTQEFSVEGMKIGESEGLNGNGGWGMIINAGTSDNYFVQGNYFQGNTSGSLSDGGTGTSKVIQGNLPQSIQAWVTYTPTVTLVGGAGNTVPVYTTNTGRYRRVDNIVHVQVYLDGDGGAEGAGSGALTIALPFAGKAVYKNNCGRAINDTTISQLNGNITASASVLALEYWSSVSVTAVFDGDKQNNTTRRIEFAFTYEVA